VYSRTTETRRKKPATSIVTERLKRAARSDSVCTTHRARAGSIRRDFGSAPKSPTPWLKRSVLRHSSTSESLLRSSNAGFHPPFPSDVSSASRNGRTSILRFLASSYSICVMLRDAPGGILPRRKPTRRMHSLQPSSLAALNRTGVSRSAGQFSMLSTRNPARWSDCIASARCCNRSPKVEETNALYIVPR
jgi:hypothetical protein